MDLAAAYEVLEVEPRATDAAVKQAYRDLSKVWHPDRFQNDVKLLAKAEVKLKQINHAYQIVTDARRASGEARHQPPPANSHATRHPNQQPPPGYGQQPPPHQNYQQPPPHQNYQQPPPHQNYQQPPPHQNHQQPPPRQNYQAPPPHYQGAPAGHQSPPTSSSSSAAFRLLRFAFLLVVIVSVRLVLKSDRDSKQRRAQRSYETRPVAKESSFSNDLRTAGVPSSDVDRVTRILTEGMQKYRQSELHEYFTKNAKTEAEGRALGSSLAMQGIARLPLARLDRWNLLRLKLAELSPAFCTGMYTGQLDDRDRIQALAKLDDPDLREWAALSGEAMLEEVRAKSPVRIDGDLVVEAFEFIPTMLDKNELRLYQAGMERSEALQGGDACAVTIILTKTAAKMPDPVRKAFLQGLSRGFEDVTEPSAVRAEKTKPPTLSSDAKCKVSLKAFEAKEQDFGKWSYSDIYRRDFELALAELRNQCPDSIPAKWQGEGADCRIVLQHFHAEERSAANSPSIASNQIDFEAALAELVDRCPDSVPQKWRGESLSCTKTLLAFRQRERVFNTTPTSKGARADLEAALDKLTRECPSSVPESWR